MILRDKSFRKPVIDHIFEKNQINQEKKIKLQTENQEKKIKLQTENAKSHDKILAESLSQSRFKANNNKKT